MANTAFTHDPTITVPSSSTANGVVLWNGTTGKNFNNTKSQHLTFNGVLLDIQNDDSAASEIRLYCDTGNAHYQAIRGGQHSGATSYTMILPHVPPTATQVLTTASISSNVAVLDWADTASSADDTAYASSWNGVTTIPPSKNAVYDKIETITAPDDTAYASSWNGVTTIAPSKNAVYDKIETLTVPSDTAYASSWNGVTTIAPSKNVVYDKIELLAPIASPIFTTSIRITPQSSAPGSPATGTIYYDTEDNVAYIWIGSSWRPLNTIPVGTATGGDITTYSGYKVHIFDNVSATENFVISTSAIICDILIIGGGGSGAGTYHGAGGGAGGFVYYNQKSLATGTYTINCGDKGSGAGGTTNNRNHTSGEDTTMTSQTTAVGGGRGGWEGTGYGAVGGSGGGSGSILTGGTPPYKTGMAGTTNQGNKGGNVPASSTGWQGTGGGGGAGGEGAPGSNTNNANEGTGGAGGAGYATGATVYDFTQADGSTVTFPTNFTNGSSATSYCGGGGGGGNTSGGSASHGGGAGSDEAGADATGYGSGGGASARQAGIVPGGDGYQGIVIIRYAV